MKRKVLAMILALCLVISAFALTSCSDDYDELALNTKYIATSDAGRESDEQSYVIFYKNNTGVYRYYYRGVSLSENYTLKFKYTYVDKDKSAVMCFYDSIDGSYSSSFSFHTWTTIFTVSKNGLMATGAAKNTYFVNEKYLKQELKNFGKKKEEKL
ncbi:MAG: hypothetical protein J1F71_02715 [Clostridiales bacterium]|nr:hypothetical protein [Clostridiales bacterium]